MFNPSEKRGIKRKADSEWGMNEDNTRCSDGQFWKRYLYDLDAFVYEAFLDSDPNMLNFGKWMVQFENVPKCFIPAGILWDIHLSSILDKYRL